MLFQTVHQLKETQRTFFSASTVREIDGSFVFIMIIFKTEFLHRSKLGHRSNLSTFMVII